ncbi:MAG: nuclease, partial [Chloroflexi bacterium]|nr:nuclease [Chloroflexota bacterium]
MKTKYLNTILCLSLLVVAIGCSSPTETPITVTRVIDGDTIEVDITGVAYRVRYIGIDTPELDDENPSLSALAQEAARYNRELLEGKSVRLEKDVSETDKYGRLLRYVYVGDTFVNAELVRLGYAEVVTYPPDIKYQELLLQAQV